MPLVDRVVASLAVLRFILESGLLDKDFNETLSESSIKLKNSCKFQSFDCQVWMVSPRRGGRDGRIVGNKEGDSVPHRFPHEV